VAASTRLERSGSSRYAEQTSVRKREAISATTFISVSAVSPLPREAGDLLQGQRQDGVSEVVGWRHSEPSPFIQMEGIEQWCNASQKQSLIEKLLSQVRQADLLWENPEFLDRD